MKRQRELVAHAGGRAATGCASGSHYKPFSTICCCGAQALEIIDVRRVDDVSAAGGRRHDDRV
jgi:hypothetical protein